MVVRIGNIHDIELKDEWGLFHRASPLESGLSEKRLYADHEGSSRMPGTQMPKAVG